MSEIRGTELEMVVESVRVHLPTNRHVLLLKEVEGGRVLPIWIGEWEARAVAIWLQGARPERPLTHDLLATTIGSLGARIARVVIASLADDTFRARLELETAGGPLELDARPSDAIALAVRLDTPIFASAEVLDRAAMLPDGTEAEPPDEADEASQAGGALGSSGARGTRTPVDGARESTGERLDPSRLAVFREFVNSLDDSERRGRPGA